MQRANGFVEKGVTTISINGVTSAASVQRAYPGATVTVYEGGTLVVATIYSDNGSTPKSNPFTASSDASWFFYAADGKYDVKFSGGGITTPWTLSDVLLDDSTTGASAVTSVFGRTGAVISANADYAFSQLSGTATVGQLPAAGGDLSGTLTNATVAKLQGRAVQNHAPADGESLLWVAGNNQWEPGTPAAVGDHATLTHLAFADTGHTGFVSLTGSEVLTNKTLTTPTIADLTNATHNHENAAGGGQIDSDALSGAVSVAKGGTGQTSYTKGDLLVALNATTLQKLTVGTNGYLLVADSTLIPGMGWKAASTASAHNLLSTTHGDSLTGTVLRGDILVGNTTPKWSRLGLGDSGAVLRSDGTDAAWGPPLIHKPSTLTFATPLATDATLGSLFRCTLTSAFTLANPTGAVDGQVLMWEFTHGGGGSNPITLDTKFVVPVSIGTIALSQEYGAVDLLEVMYRSTDDEYRVIRFVKESNDIALSVTDSMSDWTDAVTATLA